MPVSLDSIKSRMLNMKFGKLTVVSYAGKSAYGDNIWNCRCDCGTEIVRRTSNIMVGDRAACNKCKRLNGESSKKKRSFLLNKRFGRLLVITYAGRNHHDNQIWECLCDCGNKIVTRTSNLTCGATQSCGCLKVDRFVERNTTHGLTKHPLYQVFHQMKQRCYNPNCDSYCDYGGRPEEPIGMCVEWLSEEGFLNFYNWAVTNGYKPGLTIERNDNNGNYSPDNCSWELPDTQAQNRRNVTITSELVRMIRLDPRSNVDVAREYSVDASTISRIRYGRT